MFRLLRSISGSGLLGRSYTIVIGCTVKCMGSRYGIVIGVLLQVLILKRFYLQLFVSFQSGIFNHSVQPLFIEYSF